MSDTIPELLCLKYRGIHTPWEITKNARHLGFKCRKYSGWEAVHVKSDSRKVLKSTGDLLTDSKKIDLADFGHLSLIWERVQRWTKDKKDLSLEPDKRPEFDHLERLLIEGAQKPGLVDGVLVEQFKDLSKIPEIDRWAIFKTLCVLRFLRDGDRFKAITDDELSEPTSPLQVDACIKNLDGLVLLVCQRLGIKLSTKKSGDATNLFLEKLGLPSSASNEVRTSTQTIVGPPLVSVEETERTDLRLIDVSMIRGTLVVKLNSRHPAYESGSPFYDALHQKELWNSLGLACRDNLGQLDVVQSLLNSLGVHLATAARGVRRALKRNSRPAP